MSATIRISGVPEVRAMLREAGRSAFRHARRAFQDAGREFEGEFVDAHLRGTTGPHTLGSRSGGLRRSFGTTVRGDRLDRLAMAVGFGPPAHAWQKSAAIYAKTHIVGGDVGTIKPKRGKYLAIPLDRTKAGIRRGLSLRELGAEIVWVRRAPGALSKKRFRAPLDPTKAFAFPRKAGAGWVITYGGRALFVLVPSVTVPERLPLHEKLHAYLPRLVARLKSASMQAVKDAEGGGRG